MTNQDMGVPITQTPLSNNEWVTLSDVAARNVEWLWNPYIPLGKLTLFDGDPGVGKSFASCALAAALTRGYGLPGKSATEPRKVLMLSAEDGLDDTVRPRLEALDADLTKISASNSLISFDDEGMTRLEAHVAELRPALIIIDPLFAFVGGRKDIHRDNEARTITTPLARLAADYGCAIVGIRHLTKQQQKAIYAGGGSIAFSAAARSALLFGHDAHNTGKYGFVHVKSNLAPKGVAMGYRIEQTANDRGKFVWTGESDLTAEHILAMPDFNNSYRPRASAEAEDFLRQVLGDGEVAADEIAKDAESAGITRATLLRAKKALGVQVKRISKGNNGAGQWLWHLANQEPSA
jgi:hypothetical protein